MEDKKRPFRPILPGEILKEELDSRGWTQGDLISKVRPVLGEYVSA